MSTLKVDGIRSNGDTSGNDAITLVDNNTCTAKITNRSNRNVIINGDCLVAQRATSEASVSGSAAFTYNTVDRFVYGRNTDAVVNLAQEDDAPVGFNKCLQVRVTTAATSTSYARLVYRVEYLDVYRFGFGQSGTRYLTLSFYHKHTQAGTNCVMIQNPGYNRSYIAEYTQSVANTWERATITIPVDTGNHWTPANSRGMQIQWGLSPNDNVGSANTWTSSNVVVTSNQYNHLGAVDNYFRLTGIQLELGSVATDFEHRSYGEELALCQRYYQKLDHRRSSGSSGDRIMYYEQIGFNTTMRAAPSLLAASAYNSDSGVMVTYTAGDYSTTTSGCTFRHSTTNQVTVSGGDGSQYHDIRGRVHLSAEL